jgi:SAM-dependent methyltransferase
VHIVVRSALALFLVVAGAVMAQEAAKPFEPKLGQSGKDVIWVPTPDALVERMLDMARVTAQDFVIDLGSGDGRMVIAAAKRGARALGVEFDEKMVEHARRRAEQASVADRATFVQGDMFEADVSKASVLALFLLSENLDRLASKFLDMKPGSRIVLNYFTISGWTPDRTERIEDCDIWCTAHLYIVPAKVEGTWELAGARLTLRQDFQHLRGTLSRGARSFALSDARLEGDRISFTVDGTRYEGRVDGGTMTGVFGVKREPWSARWTRAD